MCSFEHTNISPNRNNFSSYNVSTAVDNFNCHPGNNSPEGNIVKNKILSLNKLIEDFNIYKHLLYTDNSYIVPKHVEKLLEIIKE
jgi:hypothetical protein